jgi:periplasmic divalent cation tolerance protein
LNEFCLVYVNATSEKEANKIVEILLEKRLIPGANIIKAPCAYWWKGKVKKRPDFVIFSTTKSKKSKEIIEEIKKVHSDKVPAIGFYELKEGNPDFLKWMDKEVK